ncbi:hypothetical protein Bb109J_c1043 [Bdellovibrio bacteriovorus]|nr:hypothetical protein Bb109J_c1043 [Bdellovibrio bacteriovorus]
MYREFLEMAERLNPQHPRKRKTPLSSSTGFLAFVLYSSDYLMSWMDTETIVETPRSCIVTPYNLPATSMVCLLWVTTMI